MTLAELVSGLEVEGRVPPGLDVRSVIHDSRRVEPGDLFVALPGARADGRRFAAEAWSRGASAVVAAGPPAESPGGPWLVHPDPRSLLPILASRVHRSPDEELVTVGVTGTNGKTSVSRLVAAVLEAGGRPCGVLGTLGHRFGGRFWPTSLTTPEATDLFATLRAMRDAGAEAAVVEISSHALAQERVSTVGLDVAVWTNLTRDHLDFHVELESYFETKRRIFGLLRGSAGAVVNVDDPWGRRLASDLPSAWTFGVEGRIRLLASTCRSDGTRLEVEAPSGRIEVDSPLVGRFNVGNLLAAVAAGCALGVAPEAIAVGLASVPPLAGRMERVAPGAPIDAFVDFAHTDQALESVLRAGRELTRGRLIVVFGCGGDRDRGKRQLMGRAAGRLADLVVATSDNPRSEDPLAILTEVEEGLRDGVAEYLLEPDRRLAIRRAVAMAEPGDTLVVAGKGHETDQIVGPVRRPFSDQDELRAAIEERWA